MAVHQRITIDSDVVKQFTACYLRVAGGECAFIETHTSYALPRQLAALEAAGRRPEDVRYIIITHAHLDHAAGASALMAVCPNATLLAHPKAARHMVEPEKLIKGATAVYGAERFQQLYGTISPIAKERVRALDDAATVELGGATLGFHHTAGHANHHFVVDDPALECVYTGDSFGLVYPALQLHGRFAIASTSPTNFDAVLAKQSLAKIRGLNERFVCLTHFDAYEDVAAIGAQVERFVDRAAQWVEEAAKTDQPVDELTKALAVKWTNAIREEAPKFGEAEFKLLALDIELNAQGLAFVANARR